MRMNYRTLSSDSVADRAALLGLIERCAGDAMGLYIHRDPDPFALGQFFGPTVTAGVFVDGLLVGSAAVSMQRRWMDGAYREVPYLHDLRVDPHYRQRGVASALRPILAHAAGEHGALGTILGDNPLGAEVLRKTGLFSGGHRTIGTTAHVVVPTGPVENSTAPAREVGFETWSAARATAPSAYTPAPSYAQRSDGRYLQVQCGKETVTALLTDEGTRRHFSVGGQTIALGYLAFLEPALPSRAALDALFAAAAPHYPMVAVGLDAGLARAYGLPTPILSTTFTFGRPSNVTDLMSTHELLLI